MSSLHLIGGTSPNDKDKVSLQVAEHLLRDIVLAKGVLKGQVELVLATDVLEALAVLLSVTLERAAPAVHVHWEVLLEGLDVVLPPAVGFTVADDPAGQLVLLCQNGRVVLDLGCRPLGHVPVNVQHVSIKSVKEKKRE